MKSLLFLYTGEAKYLMGNLRAFEMLTTKEDDIPLDMPECDKRSVQEDVEREVNNNNQND